MRLTIYPSFYNYIKIQASNIAIEDIRLWINDEVNFFGKEVETGKYYLCSIMVIITNLPYVEGDFFCVYSYLISLLICTFRRACMAMQVRDLPGFVQRSV